MRYRPEIDGLRAVAVASVILYHAGFQLFSGGYVGVDVFFVISGYLITDVIIREKEIGQFSLADFYERRIRRIFPALFVVVFFSIIFAWVWAPPVEMKDFSQSLVALSFFSSNVLFWLESGYFDTSTEVKPLIHTWSLSVEEQFYALFPVVLIIAWRYGKQSVVFILVALSIMSFALAQWGTSLQLEAKYYLLPTRGWELLVGALIAFWMNNRKSGSQVIAKQQSIFFPQALSFVGAILIVYAVFSFDRHTPFPSVYTIIPVAGAALIILYANSSALVGTLLRSKLLVGIGLISYSAYLWHQPIFAFARLRSPSSLSPYILLSLSLFSIVLAYISWKFVEIPFRNRKYINCKTVYTCGIAGMILFATFGAIGHLSDGYLIRSSLLSDIRKIRTIEGSYCHNAGRRIASQLDSGDFCTLGTGNTPTFAVIGDSHAGAIFESLNEYKAAKPFLGYAISGSFCAPLINEFKLGIYSSPDCVDTNRAAFEKIIKTRTITDVILYAEWANYTKGYRDQGNGVDQIPALAFDTDGISNSASENIHVFERSLLKTVDALLEAGKRVSIVKPTPEFDVPVIRQISKNILLEDSKFISSSMSPYIEYREYLRRNSEVLFVFGKLENVRFIETSELFCDDHTCHSVKMNKKVLFSDTNHVTEYGADLIVEEIMKNLGK